MMETKICSNPTCIYFGNPQLIVEFHRRTYKNGIIKTKPRCKHCENGYKHVYNINNSDKRSEYNKIYNKENKEYMTSLKRNWRENNRERNRYNLQEWAKNNPERISEKDAARRARVLNALPIWADRLKIKEFYRQSKYLTKTTGIKYSVDHIIPLISKNRDGEQIACGLHNEFNLQVIPLLENQIKSCYLD